jgi:hypothetical protein
MKQVTRDIDPGQARDLLERVPRACISFSFNQEPQVLPVALWWEASRFLVRLPAHTLPLPEAGEEAVLLVDEGVAYFDLRAIYVRGEVHPIAAPTGQAAGFAWFELIPLKTVAWDYGMMREVNNGG